ALMHRALGLNVLACPAVEASCASSPPSASHRHAPGLPPSAARHPFLIPPPPLPDPRPTPPTAHRHPGTQRRPFRPLYAPHTRGRRPPRSRSANPFLRRSVPE